MLTGVEVAGLVLGSIPLLVSALEHYAEGVSTIEKWWRFERELSTIKRLLTAEQVVFQGTCERLLDGLVPPSELDDLIDNAGGSKWNKDLDTGLRKRLGRSYSSFNDCVEDMYRVINELKSRLDLDPEGKPLWAEGPSFTKQIKKIYFSISRSRYEDSLQALAKNNNVLATLLSQSLELEPLRKRRSSTSGAHDLIRTNANMLYQEMKKRWICKCKDMHKVKLQLNARSKSQHKPGGSSLLSFDLIFCTRNKVNSSWTEQAANIIPQAERTPAPGPAPAPATDTTPSPETKKKPILRSIFSKKSKAKLLQASVKFTETPQPNGQSSETTSKTGPEIEDLCNMFSNLTSPPDHGSSIGHFTCDEELTLIVAASSSNAAPTIYSNLNLFLSSRGKFRMSRGDRYGLALTIASSVLQLSPTQWLSEAWNKADIQVLLEHPIVTAEKTKSLEVDYSKRLYIEKSFPEHDDSETASAAKNVFPGLRNQALFRLGIVLIELCLGETLESLRATEDPLTKDGTSNILTEWATATRLIHDVSREAGNRYGDAVRRCIYCDFDQRSTSFENNAFRQAVYDGIVAPLEDVYEDYISESFRVI